jgi:hypothetical protein
MREGLDSSPARAVTSRTLSKKGIKFRQPTRLESSPTGPMSLHLSLVVVLGLLLTILIGEPGVRGVPGRAA